MINPQGLFTETFSDGIFIPRTTKIGGYVTETYYDELATIARQHGLIAEVGENEAFHVSYPVYPVEFKLATAKEDKPFMCPECGRLLVVSDKRATYQTQAEHVFDIIPESRITLVCGDKNCITRSMNLYWGTDGSLFLEYKDEKAREWYNQNKIDYSNRETHKNKGTDAINSWYYFYDRIKCKENKTNIHNFWYNTALPKISYWFYKAKKALGLLKS